MQKPTNPTSAFLNLKSSIDTTQSSEKCCFLPLSWLSDPFTFWNVPFLFPFHLALTVPGSANKNEPSTEAILLFSGCTLLIPYPPISPVICMMNFNISNTFFFHKQSFFSIMSAWGSMCSVLSVRFGFAHKWKSHTKAPNTYWWMRIWITWIPLFVILMNIHTVIAKSAQNVSSWVN